MTDGREAASRETGNDPGRVPIEDRWGPVTGRRRVEGDTTSFRRRWLAALLCMLLLIGGLALLGI